LPNLARWSDWAWTGFRAGARDVVAQQRADGGNRETAEFGDVCVRAGQRAKAVHRAAAGCF
jgi:hypothetical protein